MRFSLIFILCINLISNELKADSLTLAADTLQLEYSSWNTKFRPLNFTKIKDFHRYRSDLYTRPYLRLGNLGLAARRFDTINIETGALSIMGDYQPYLLTERNIKFYQTKKPFTSLHYINGAESEQYFRLFHTQNFNESGNFSFAYNRITSEGFFVDQFTNHTNLLANYNLMSKNNRFKSKAFFSLNVLEAQENGGIVLADNDDPTDNTILLNVNLNEAQNQLRGQYAKASNSYLIYDNDSSMLKNIIVFYELDWNRNSKKYVDLTASNINFYDNEYFDLTNTRDSTFIQEVKNSFGLNVLNNKVSTSIEFLDMDIFQNYIINDEISSMYLNLKAEDSLFNGKLKVGLKKGLNGYHREENYVHGTFSSKYKTIDYSIGFISQNQRVNPLMSRHRTNHFFYDLELDLIQTRKFQFTLSHKKSKSKIKLSQESIKSYYYFDSTALPTQNTDLLNILRVSANKDFEFLKHFNLTNQLNYQIISDVSVLPLPELSSNHCFFYSNRFFKRALNFQIGLDYTFVQSSKGYRYNPALATFHLTNGENDLPDIHQLDLFMNIGITDAAKMFIKMENVLLPTFSEDSYFVHNMPIPGRALKVGLYWRMIN